MIIHDSGKYIQKKCKVAKGVLDMFPDGKWQNSALMKSFKMIWRTFYIVRYCATLWRGDLIWKGHRWRFRGGCSDFLHVYLIYGKKRQIHKNIQKKSLARMAQIDPYRQVNMNEPSFSS